MSCEQRVVVTRMCVLALMSSAVCLMTLQIFANGSETSHYQAFSECKEGVVSPASPMKTVTVSTPSTCAMSCMQTETCVAYNLCGSPGNSFQCSLFSALKPDRCAGMNIQSQCVYMEQQSPCQNAGTWAPPDCNCVDGYAGQYCERYIRSCQEGWDLGVRVNRFYTIQPFGSPVTYQIYCSLQYSKTGYVFIRKRGHTCTPPVNYDTTWNDYKHGWGDVPCNEYFLGLETMYQLMKYEQFQVHIYGRLSGGREINFFYSNFTILSEDEGYKMTYDEAFNGGHAGDDGLGTERPRAFCTRDRDCGSCAMNNGGGWWYSTGCGGHPMTSSLTNFKWPVDGNDEDIDDIFWQFDHMAYWP